ncbi:MAG: serine O-acetyltransferase [Stellaceae bacterium]
MMSQHTRRTPARGEPTDGSEFLIIFLGQLYPWVQAARGKARAGAASLYIVKPMLLRNLRDEIDATLARDPAARSRIEVVLCYPGFHALLWHRAARWVWDRGWQLTGRFLSHLGRMLTGIEIHPGARIGRRLFIDHGMGLVIGETAEIGDDCTLYSGVTLGGRLPRRGELGQKRHPTLGNGVIVGSGAQILGPFRVGDGARIGAGAVVINEVPDGVTMVGPPARAVPRRGAAKEAEPAFMPYGIPADIPDPIARTLTGLLDEVTSLRARLAELERGGPAHRAETAEPPPLPHSNGAGKKERLS